MKQCSSVQKLDSSYEAGKILKYQMLLHLLDEKGAGKE